MSSAPDEFKTDALLRRGLHALPVPQTSADFDGSVLAAIKKQTPRWMPWKSAARSLLTTASFSLGATLIALAFLGRPTARHEPDATAAGRYWTTSGATTLDQALEDANLDAASASTLAPWNRRVTARAAVPQSKPRSSHMPEQRSEQLSAPAA